MFEKLFGKLVPQGRSWIEFENRIYDYGESIEGRAFLELEKPVNAREFYIGLYKIVLRSSSMGKSRREVLIRKQTLDEEKEYKGFSYYNFSIRMPMKTTNIVEQIANMSTVSIYPKSYFLKTTLDIPGARDIHSKLYAINIR